MIKFQLGKQQVFSFDIQIVLSFFYTCCILFNLLIVTMYIILINSDEFEPSWLEQKVFQLGSARLVAFFTSARNQKLAENEPKFDSQFLINFYNKLVLKMINYAAKSTKFTFCANKFR